jgi:hypothetical protein
MMTNNDVKSVIKQLRQADFGSHYIVIYPNLAILREIYSNYTLTQIEENNEIVVLIPYYETTDSVRSVLQKSMNSSSNSTNTSNAKKIRKYEKQNRLVIIDSVKAYFTLKMGLESFIQNLVEQAKSTGRNGVSVITDAGSFSLFEIRESLVEYELNLPSHYNDLPLKRFCIYNQAELNTFPEEKKQKLLKHHTINLVVTA